MPKKTFTKKTVTKINPGQPVYWSDSEEEVLKQKSKPKKTKQQQDSDQEFETVYLDSQPLYDEEEVKKTKSKSAQTRKLPKFISKEDQKECSKQVWGEVMKKFEKGSLSIGNSKYKVSKNNPSQAKAIALSISNKKCGTPIKKKLSARIRRKQSLM